jgi:hypothetical protein
MLPDGVLFAFKSEVQTQVFCKEKLIGKTEKIRGTGILQLPNGCVLSVLDKHGKITKVKGQPQYTLVAAGRIELMPNGPLTALMSDVDTNGTQKVDHANTFVEKYVSSVISQVNDVDNKVNTQHNHVWALTGAILMIILSSLLMGCILFRYRYKIRTKLRILKRNFADVTQHVFDIEAGHPDQPMNELDSNPPPPPRRKRDVIRDQLRDQRQRVRLLMHDTELPSVGARDPTYLNLSMRDLYNRETEDRYVDSLRSFRPLPSLRDLPKEYPNLSPFMKRAQALDKDLILEEETELVEKLCESGQTSPTQNVKTSNQ